MYITYYHEYIKIKNTKKQIKIKKHKKQIKIIKKQKPQKKPAITGVSPN